MWPDSKDNAPTDLTDHYWQGGQHEPMEYAEDDGVRLMCEGCGVELNGNG